MSKRLPPIATTLLTAITVIASVSVAIKVHGTPWGSVPILELSRYGGLDRELVAQGEWWRLLSSQFVHVKQAHMLFNAAMLFLLGGFYERSAGALRLLLIWLIAGAAGTFISTFFAPSPWNVGSGASQAVLAISAAVFALFQRGYSTPKWIRATLLVSVGFAFLLDLISAHYPKPGHVAGLLLGYFMARAMMPNDVVDKGIDDIASSSIDVGPPASQNH